MTSKELTTETAQYLTNEMDKQIRDMIIGITGCAPHEVVEKAKEFKRVSSPADSGDMFYYKKDGSPVLYISDIRHRNTSEKVLENKTMEFYFEYQEIWRI